MAAQPGSAPRGPRGADPRQPCDDWVPAWSSLADAFRAREDDERTYLIELQGSAPAARREWSVGAWKHEVLSVASTLVSVGAAPGTSVAVLGGNTAETLAAVFGCWVAGAACFPLDPDAPVELQLDALVGAGATVLVHGPAQAERAAYLRDRTVTGPPTVLPLDLDSPTRPSAAWPQAGLDSRALVLHSGGTTGAPKAVRLTALNLLVNFDAMIRAFGWGPDTRTLCVLPIHHGNGLLINAALPWFAGGSVVLRDRLRVGCFWSDVAAEGVTTASLVPTVLEYLTVAGSADTGLREVLTGSGPLTTRTARAFETTFGVPVRQLYGLAESTAVLTVVPTTPEANLRRAWQESPLAPSVGRVVPHAEVEVADPAGQPCPDGREGEVVARGAMVMEGYADEAATAMAFRSGWLHTGDRGRWWRDPRGDRHLLITGRSKEVIIRGGINISPHEVDTALASHPAVLAAATVGFPHRWYGEEVAAVVVRRAPVSDAELIAHCVRIVGFAQAPKVILDRTAIPRTSTGKLLRSRLASDIGSELAAHYNTRFSAPPSAEVV